MKISEEKIRVLQKHLGTDDAIATYLGISRQRVHAIRKRHGIKSHREKSGEISEPERKYIRVNYLNCKTKAWLIKATGRTHRQITKALEGLPTPKEIAQERDKSIFQRYQAGMFYKDIAKEHGVSPGTVNSIIRRMLGQKRTKSTSNYYKMRDHDIRRDLASGMTQKDVAVRYGVTQERISQIFQRDRDKIVGDIASKGHSD